MKQTQAAFTLFEVLIAVVVLSIGLLGLASLQAAGMRNNNSAYMRSQASVLAYDIADRIRANRQGSASYTGGGNPQTNCLNTTGCTPVELAENDISEWQEVITNTLPMGAGTIEISGNVYTINIVWDDDHSGATANDPVFTTRFIP